MLLSLVERKELKEEVGMPKHKQVKVNNLKIILNPIEVKENKIIIAKPLDIFQDTDIILQHQKELLNI